MWLKKVKKKHNRAQSARIAIIGAVGVPGNYGGFETLAQNLVDFHRATDNRSHLTVYCSAKAFSSRPDTYGNAVLRYINLDANGAQSIPYDAWSLYDAVRRGDNQLLLLGVSGALCLPLLRLLSHARIVTNIDGIEWRREKWQGLTKIFLRVSEWAAVKFSHMVIADNQAIADYVLETYGRRCDIIPYGGDHALGAGSDPSVTAGLPVRYALALCRIEPENNVAMILEAFAELDIPLVFVGNWDNSEYGRKLKARYQSHPRIVIHDPVYEPRSVRAIRDGARLYVHGHSAGGTNPSLVEMMHFGIPIIAHGCDFNRHSTEGKALYFDTSDGLAALVHGLDANEADAIGPSMREIAQRRYTWAQIGKAYFDLLERP
jgi:glycosyltransferase involved in cell wall biosynthesis